MKTKDLEYNNEKNFKVNGVYFKECIGKSA